jgi:hypothetical protein
VLEQAGGALQKAPHAGGESSKAAVRRWFAEFLDAHAARAELGLRLDGEQVAAGVRFLEIVRDDAYDVVVGNPPYQGTSKLAEADWFKRYYPRAKADLYACFLERSLALAKPGGVSALLTMRGWMFLSQFQALREHLLREFDLRALGDFDRGAFDDVPNEVLAVAVTIVAKRKPCGTPSIATQPTSVNDAAYDRARTSRKRAAVLAQVGRYEFDVAKLSGIEGTPLVYWWDADFIARYLLAEKVGAVAPVRVGMKTSNNLRFVRRPWELSAAFHVYEDLRDGWVPYVQGASGHVWMEPLRELVDWRGSGFAVRVTLQEAYGMPPQCDRMYFKKGIAFSPIGAHFTARAYKFASIFSTSGPSLFPDDTCRPEVLCSLNSSKARYTAQSLNPGTHFEVGDVARVPLVRDPGASEIVQRLAEAFHVHECHRECSVEFRSAGSSSWRCAQDWAQQAVDRRSGEDLPFYQPEYDAPHSNAYVSFAIGVAIGRFGVKAEGILTCAPATALPAGILYLSGSETLPDSLSLAAASPITTAWTEHAPAILVGPRQDLGDWLRKDFFPYHKKLYENRPIYFPLSSSQRNFVAFISIHRWTDNTLQALIADHLHPNLRQLDETIADLNQARASSDRKTASGADRQYTQIKKLRDELADFITKVTECAERGAPPTAANCPPRDADAPFRMDLDDGVMINSAALWPLLEPQWKDPKKWWKELCEAKGRKDYDWAHLAARYFPKRVDDKCRTDPSLAVAHGCFWKYHPAKAYAWELRLAHEIGPEFAIGEPDAAQHRTSFSPSSPSWQPSFNRRNATAENDYAGATPKPNLT